MNYLEPWWSVDEINEFHKELERETTKGHVLHGISTKCIARRQDQDDFLFQLTDGSGRFVVVHLTWSEERDPAWPWAELYNDFNDWRTRRMLPDAKEWAELLENDNVG
jgi:hypothetical protein